MIESKACRLEDDRRRAHPDELLATTHAACFAMAFSFAHARAACATRTLERLAGATQEPCTRATPTHP
jgi:osmotically inducible protein OsmC